MTGRARRIALAAVTVVLFGLAGLALWRWQQFDAAGPAEADVTLVLPRGSGLGQIADQLAAAGVVRSSWLFIADARLTGAAHELRAGEYRFLAHATPRQVLTLLREGRTVVRHLTIPEGLTSAEILALLHDAPGLFGELPPPPAEGTLLPETYNYSWGDGRAAMLARMERAMAETLAKLWPNRAAGLPLATPAQAVTLASLVEKETALADERPRVAGVFVNRLRLGMRLQSDPTVVYALTGGRAPLGRELTRADLDTPSPYNTYRVDGLPPGPIANPGRAAIAAALQPLASRELYFVADGNGGHAFASTLEEHNRNVSRWRKLQ